MMMLQGARLGGHGMEAPRLLRASRRFDDELGPMTRSVLATAGLVRRADRRGAAVSTEIHFYSGRVHALIGTDIKRTFEAPGLPASRTDTLMLHFSLGMPSPTANNQSIRLLDSDIRSAEAMHEIGMPQLLTQLAPALTERATLIMLKRGIPVRDPSIRGLHYLIMQSLNDAAMAMPDALAAKRHALRQVVRTLAGVR